MGNLRYHGTHVYYHFTDQTGKKQKLSFKLSVDKIKKDPRGNETFPAEAHELKRRIDREVFLGVWGLDVDTTPSRLGLKEAFTLFIKAYQNKNTVNAYTLAYDKLFEYFDDVNVAVLEEDDMLNWRKELYETHPNKTTVEFIVRHAKIFFAYLEKESFIGRSPITKRVRIKPVDSPIVIFSDEDIEKLWKGLKAKGYTDAYNQLYFLLLVGWRVSDSCDLTRTKIDHNRRVIQHYIGKPDKTWEYPMDAKLSRFLAKLPKDHDPYVFLYRDYHSLGKLFREVIDDPKNAIHNHTELSIHTLRKQFTFNCFRQGVPLEICSRLLGHSSVKTTEKYYTYWDTQLLRDGLTKSRKGRKAGGRKAETFRKRKTA